MLDERWAKKFHSSNGKINQPEFSSSNLDLRGRCRDARHERRAPGTRGFWGSPCVAGHKVLRANRSVEFCRDAAGQAGGRLRRPRRRPKILAQGNATRVPRALPSPWVRIPKPVGSPKTQLVKHLSFQGSAWKCRQLPAAAGWKRESDTATVNPYVEERTTTVFFDGRVPAWEQHV